MFGRNNKDNKSENNNNQPLGMSKTEMAKKAFELQRLMSKIDDIELEHKGYTIKVNAKMQVKSIKDPEGVELNKIVKLVNKGISKAQHETSQVFQNNMMN